MSLATDPPQVFDIATCQMAGQVPGINVPSYSRCPLIVALISFTVTQYAFHGGDHAYNGENGEMHMGTLALEADAPECQSHLPAQFREQWRQMLMGLAIATQCSFHLLADRLENTTPSPFPSITLRATYVRWPSG